MCPLPRTDASKKSRDKRVGIRFPVCCCEKLRAGLDSNQEGKGNSPLYTIGLRWCKCVAVVKSLTSIHKNEGKLSLLNMITKFCP